MKIEKKIWPEFFEKVASGEKTCDVRLADFACRAGDLLVLREWDPKAKKYTGRSITKKITHVVRTKDMKFWAQEDIEKHGYLIISFK